MPADTYANEKHAKWSYICMIAADMTARITMQKIHMTKVYRSQVLQGI